MKGSSPEEKKRVDARRNASGKAHERKIDSLLNKAPVAAEAAPSPDGYLRRIVNRRDGAQIELLDTMAADAPAGSESGLRYAVRCRTHGSDPEFYATEAEAMRAAKSPEDWCDGCAAVDHMKPKVNARAKAANKI